MAVVGSSSAVFAGTIQNGSIGTAQLANLSVTLGKMAANSVDSSKIVDGSVAIADLVAGLGFPRVARTQLGAPAANIDFTGLSGVGGYLIIAQLRSSRATKLDTVKLVINNNTTASNYAAEVLDSTDAATFPTSQVSQASATIGTCIAASGTALFNNVLFAGVFNAPDSSLPYTWFSCSGSQATIATAGDQQFEARSGICLNAGGVVINQLTLAPVVGPNFVLGSWAALYQFV